MRPDKVGQYRGFVRLRVDPIALQGRHVVRPWGWHVALIVSEQVKRAVEAIGRDGTVFRPVS